jgi:soluble lytic murein transglycosylase
LISGGCSSDDHVSHTSSTIPTPVLASDGSHLNASTPQTVTTPTRVASASSSGLSVDMAAPYFRGEGARKFALEEWKEARVHFARALEGARGARRARLRVVIAECDAHLRQWKSAAQGFEAALPRLGLIADYLHYQAARAWYFAHDLDKSLAHARKVDADSIQGADAELLAGDVLRAKKRWAEVAVAYKDYLTRRPKGFRRAEANYKRAEGLEQSGKPRSQTLPIYRKVTLEWPLSSWAKRAQKRIDVLTKSSARLHAKYSRFDANELITKGLAYFKAQRNRKAAATMKAALRAPGLDREAACVAAYHRAYSWWKERRRTKSAPLFDQAIKLCARTKNKDLQVKSAYQAGRSYGKIRKYRTAAKRYARIEKYHKDHSYADDARIRRAESYEDAGDDHRVEGLLATVPDRYPKGDMRAEAMWRLAFRAIKNNKFERAIKWLKKQIKVMPLDNNYWAEGQAQYWLGRSYGKLGRSADAAKAYEEAVRKYPLSFYALLALNRLREKHSQRFTKLVSELEKAPPGYNPKQSPFHFKQRAVYSSAGFRRAMELLKLGLGKASEAELRKLGFTAPKKRIPVTDADKIDKLWAMAFLYHRAARYKKSHWPTRYNLVDYKRSWPTGHNRARWQIAYPKAYWNLVDKNAKKHGYPAALQLGIMREESAFNPLLESWANAIGLTQMIFPTARRFGRGTGIKINRANLRDPEKNMTIGSNFLGFLWKMWDGHVALAVPSYNAGEGATMRWLRKRGGWAVDAWIEEIPFDQTRRYTKRVMASYFAYQWLENGQVPTIANRVPKKLIKPKRKKRSRKKRRRKKR